MKLTPHLVSEAPCHSSPECERTLSLRSLNIPAIENLASVRDTVSAIDLTDNDIQILGDFPILPKVRTLLIARNVIYSVQASIAEYLPDLKTLSLINNSITNFSEIEPLAKLNRLENLYLTGNPIAVNEHYRLWVIWRVDQLLILDFEKIKAKERQEAVKLFGSKDSPSELAQQIMNAKPREEDHSGEKTMSINAKKLSTEQIAELREQLAKATNLDEIDRIERTLKGSIN